MHKVIINNAVFPNFASPLRTNKLCVTGNDESLIEVEHNLQKKYLLLAKLHKQNNNYNKNTFLYHEFLASGLFDEKNINFESTSAEIFSHSSSAWLVSASDVHITMLFLSRTVNSNPLKSYRLHQGGD